MAKKKLLPRLTRLIRQLIVLRIHSAVLIPLIVLGVIVFGFDVNKSTHRSLVAIPSALAQRISPSDIWQQVYQQLPDFPKENNYTSKDTGKIAENNTLASRLIRYHIYVKERTPIYRLDWKLTLADYLGANEIMYENTYPGNDTLKQNPLEADRAAIMRLNRRQRDAFVQVLTNIFNPNSPTPLTPNTNPNTSTPQPPPSGGAELLK